MPSLNRRITMNRGRHYIGTSGWSNSKSSPTMYISTTTPTAIHRTTPSAYSNCSSSSPLPVNIRTEVSSPTWPPFPTFPDPCVTYCEISPRSERSPSNPQIKQELLGQHRERLPQQFDEWCPGQDYLTDARAIYLSSLHVS